MDDDTEAARVASDLTARGIDVLRVSYADLLGIERSREVFVDTLPRVQAQGLAFCRATFHTTSTGETVAVPGGLAAGLPDVHVVPDLETVLPVPWEPGVAGCLGDVRELSGQACMESPRAVLRAVVRSFAETGLAPVVGPELEYFVLEPDPASPRGWRRYGDEPGNVYVSGSKADPAGHLTATMRALRGLGLGVTGGNHEFCRGQFEINLAHSPAFDSADRAFRFKNAVKDLERRAGRVATFMSRPFNDEGASGFHLHVSLCDGDGRNVGAAPDEPHGLSAVLRHAIAGLLAHAPALTLLANPTVNSYTRLVPDMLAPWLVDWGLDNRSAMVRIPPDRGAGTRLELRLPDSSANPYLLYSGVLAAMALGIEAKEEPPPPLVGYGYDATKAPVLPSSLVSALAAFEADTAMRERLGAELSTAYAAMKRDEVERHRRWVGDWEWQEYAHDL